MRQKSPPIKVRQNSSASKFSASKIIKKINASKFCASEITPSVSASFATLRQNSMSQNSRVIVPCIKRSVRHRPFSQNMFLENNFPIFVHCDQTAVEYRRKSEDPREATVSKLVDIPFSSCFRLYIVPKALSLVHVIFFPLHCTAIR